jgi:hypothetical protein
MPVVRNGHDHRRRVLHLHFRIVVHEQAVRSDVAFVRERPAVSVILGDRSEYLADFLIAEYQHIGDSFLQNEEDGERRASFFITSISILVAVLGAAPKDSAAADFVVDHPRAAIGCVLILGILALLRIARRNVVTDEYLRGLAVLRKCFVARDLASVLPYNPYERKTRAVWKRIFHAGWAQLIAIVNAGLVYLLVIVGRSGSDLWQLDALALAALALAVQVGGAQWHRTSAARRAEAEALESREQQTHD